MEKRHIITIAGGLGSGKSTTASIVAEKLNYPHYSGGDFMRDMATKRAVSLEELGALAKTDSEIDKEIDAIQKKFMDENESFVIDSRLGWYFAPKSFKVFLSLDADTAAERVLADLQNHASHRSNELSQIPQTVAEVKAKQMQRVLSEKDRYNKYYGIEDHYDPKNFDLIVDTKENNPNQVAELIIEGYKNWLDSK